MLKELKEPKELNKLKRVINALLVCSVAIILCGCSKVQIFMEKTDPNAVTYVTQDEMTQNVLYAKDGSYFYNLYNPLTTASGEASVVSSNRLIFYPVLDSFPKIYKEGYLAVASNDVPKEPVTLERYENIGYSLGLYNGYIDEDGYICFDVDNFVQGSNIQRTLGELPNDYIRICQINDEDVSYKNLIAGGVIGGLEYGGQYKITYYAGTYKNSVTCYADTGIMRSYEIFQTEEPEVTDNTYTKFKFPSDLKSGYYKCSSLGFIAYYDFEKGEKDTSEIDMNDAYYKTPEEQFKAFSKKYAISIPEIKQNIRIEATYELGNHNVEDVKCILSDPSGKTYDMTCDETTAYVEISEMMAGTWYVNILPKDLEVITVAPIATTPENDTINDTKEFVFDEASSNVKFVCKYTGEGEIWGTIEQESTKDVKELTVDSSNKELTVTYPYLAADTYKVTIYHYIDTAVEEITYGIDAETQEVELVIIE